MKTIKFLIDEVYVNSPVVLSQNTIDLTEEARVAEGRKGKSQC